MFLEKNYQKNSCFVHSSTVLYNLRLDFRHPQVRTHERKLQKLLQLERYKYNL